MLQRLAGLQRGLLGLFRLFIFGFFLFFAKLLSRINWLLFSSWIQNPSWVFRGVMPPVSCNWMLRGSRLKQIWLINLRPFDLFRPLLSVGQKIENIKMQIVVAELRAVNSPCCGQTPRYTSGKGLSQTEKPESNEAGREEERGFGSTPKPPGT